MRDGLLALLCVPLAAGCSYDWAVPADASAETAPVEASGSDAADATKPPDAPDDGSTDASAADVPDAVEADSFADCSASEEMTVQQDRAKALVCTGVTPNPCEISVQDECGCPVIVATTNAAEMAYLTAVQQLKQMCKPLCQSTCGPAPSMGLCIVTDAGGATLACVQ
jgi:hypothetical protein